MSSSEEEREPPRLAKAIVNKKRLHAPTEEDQQAIRLVEANAPIEYTDADLDVASKQVCI